MILPNAIFGKCYGRAWMVGRAIHVDTARVWVPRSKRMACPWGYRASETLARTPKIPCSRDLIKGANIPPAVKLLSRMMFALASNYSLGKAVALLSP